MWNTFCFLIIINSKCKTLDTYRRNLQSVSNYIDWLSLGTEKRITQS